MTKQFKDRDVYFCFTVCRDPVHPGGQGLTAGARSGWSYCVFKQEAERQTLALSSLFSFCLAQNTSPWDSAIHACEGSSLLSQAFLEIPCLTCPGVHLSGAPTVQSNRHGAPSILIFHSNPVSTCATWNENPKIELNLVPSRDCHSHFKCYFLKP